MDFYAHGGPLRSNVGGYFAHRCAHGDGQYRNIVGIRYRLYRRVDSSASQPGNTTTIPDSTCSISTVFRNFDFPGNDGESNRSHVDPVDRVACNWDGYLFWIQSSSQQGSTRTRKCDAGYGIELMGEHFN